MTPFSLTLPSLLVIDDEPNNFDVIEALLSPGGDEPASQRSYSLHYADNGPSAIAALDTLQPDLILLDVMMPEMDGIEVCRQIKAMPRWQAVPIIMVTALTAKADLARCLEAGADDFISKPVNLLELRARIQSMLRIKQQYDQLQSFAQLQRDTINLLGWNLKELRGDMAAELSQEFNAPLTSILGSIGILKADLGGMRLDKAQQLLEMAYQAGLGLERLSQKFLFYLRLSADYQSPEASTEVAASSLIEYISQLKASQFQRQADLICELEDVRVSLPYAYFQRLVEELLDNAFQFSQPGTPVIVLCNASANQFNLRLVDQGCGMTSDQMISASTSSPSSAVRQREQQQLGLGLKIVRRIVALCNGRLEFSSISGKGTSVHIAIPLNSAPTPALALAAEP